MYVKNSPEYIEGKVARDVAVSVFDGRSLKEVAPSGGMFKASHGATTGLYEVVFITKEGFSPETVALKAGESSGKIKLKPLQAMKDREKGILTGVVYKYVAGGKLKAHSGISVLFKGEKVTITKGDASYTAVTDATGVFMIELPAGEYEVALGNKKAGKAAVGQGKTTIKNLQKGITLVD